MKTPTWMTAAVLGVSMTAAPMAFGQADLQLQQAQQREREARQREQAQTKQERQASQQERRQEKREREQLGNMPEKARKVLRAETANAENVDYFREGEEGSRTFGARFTRPQDKHQVVVKVDRTGNVISRDDETAAQQAKASAPGQTAPQQPAPAQPAPTPAPTPAPAPTSPTASREAPHSSDPMYRELRADEVPANIRALLDKEAAGGRNVKYYRTKYGKQTAYEVKWTPQNGERQVFYVNDAGQTLVRRAENAQPKSDNDREEEARTASGRESANRDNERDDGIELGRAQINELPRPVQTKFRQMTQNGKNVEYFKTKYGRKQAYQVDFRTTDDKKTTIYLDEQGNVLSHKVDGKQLVNQDRNNDR